MIHTNILEIQLSLWPLFIHLKEPLVRLHCLFTIILLKHLAGSHSIFACFQYYRCLNKKCQWVTPKSKPKKRKWPKLRSSAPAVTPTWQTHRLLLARQVFLWLKHTMHGIQTVQLCFQTQKFPRTKDTNNMNLHGKWYVLKTYIGFKIIDLSLKYFKMLTKRIQGYNDINTICAVATINESATHFFFKSYNGCSCIL